MTTPRTALTGLAIIAALMLGACRDDKPPTAATAIEVSGWVEISRWVEDGNYCAADAGLPAAGTSVVVTDRAGKTLAQTTLGTGWLQRLRAHSDDYVTVRCLLHFYLSVPGGLDEYGLTVTGEETRWMSAARIAQPGLAL